jgi:DUF2934 family protein
MIKPKRRRPDNVFPMAAVESKPVTVDASANVTHADIARRIAFEIYCLRGCQHGRDLDDWLQAEGELRNATRFAVA